jgi:predicted nuclease of predicted toxin-antitoxin system
MMAKELHAPVVHKSLFRFYEELNDFLAVRLRKRAFTYNKFIGTPSIKDTIEAIGVPHTEVDLILVDGESVDFGYKMKGDEHVSVYPVIESLDITPIIHLRSKPLRKTKFIVDVNLGKLAMKLRLLGFDTLFRNDFKDEEIIKISLSENRIILTRDKGILKNNAVTHGFWIRNENVRRNNTEITIRWSA